MEKLTKVNHQSAQIQLTSSFDWARYFSHPPPPQSLTNRSDNWPESQNKSLSLSILSINLSFPLSLLLRPMFTPVNHQPPIQTNRYPRDCFLCHFKLINFHKQNANRIFRPRVSFRDGQHTKLQFMCRHRKSIAIRPVVRILQQSHFQSIAMCFFFCFSSLAFWCIDEAAISINSNNGKQYNSLIRRKQKKYISESEFIYLIFWCFFLVAVAGACAYGSNRQIKFSLEWMPRT